MRRTRGVRRKGVSGASPIRRRFVGVWGLVCPFFHDAPSNTRPGLEVVHPARTRFELLIEDFLFYCDLPGCGSDERVAENRTFLAEFSQLFNEDLLNFWKF